MGAIRTAFLDTGAVAVGVVSGGVALALFVGFAVGLCRRVGPGAGWRAGLVGALVGPLPAMVGVVSDGVLAAHVTRLSDPDVRFLFEIHPRMQLLGGVFIALLLLGVGVGGLRTGSLPRTLAWPACLIGAPLLLAPLALLDGSSAVATVPATVGFGLFSVWVFLTGVWLVLAGPVSGIAVARRAVFLVLVVAAGPVGLTLLAVPAATSTFFSWGLTPPPLAAFAGGAYLGSAVVYAAGLTRPRHEVRGLVLGAAVLPSSVLVVSVAHRDQFDLGPLPAWAWFVLFVAFTLLTTALLALDRDVGGPPRGTGQAWWRRGLLAAVASTLVALSACCGASPGSRPGSARSTWVHWAGASPDAGSRCSPPSRDGPRGRAVWPRRGSLRWHWSRCRPECCSARHVRPTSSGRAASPSTSLA